MNIGNGAENGSTRTLWLDPGFGASGDMMLGVLMGLGAPLETIRAGLGALSVSGWTLDLETALRCSLSSSRAVVETDEGHHHRTWSSIDRMLADSDLPDAVKGGSRATFRRLGEVEAGIHDVDIDEVHFHEVGAIDAIVDIVGSWLALDQLNVGTVISGPVGLGSGSTTAAHGRLPVPAPATASLLIGANVKPVDVEAETVTPTGAALLTTMADRWGPVPAGSLTASARGAGGRNPDHYPNVITAYLLTTTSTTDDDPVAENEGATTHPAMLLTTNLDDVTPEIIGHTIARCLADGADDAWATPVIMKKGRPGFEFNVLCSADRLNALSNIVFSETGTLGLRTQPVTKHVQPRRFEEVTVRGHTIRMKIGPYGVKAEYDDLARASNALNLAVRQLAAEARDVFNDAHRGLTFGSSVSNDSIREPN